MKEDESALLVYLLISLCLLMGRRAEAQICRYVSTQWSLVKIMLCSPHNAHFTILHVLSINFNRGQKYDFEVTYSPVFS